MIRVHIFGGSRWRTVTISFVIPTVAARASEVATTLKAMQNAKRLLVIK